MSSCPGHKGSMNPPCNPHGEYRRPVVTCSHHMARARRSPSLLPSSARRRARPRRRHLRRHLPRHQLCSARPCAPLRRLRSCLIVRLLMHHCCHLRRPPHRRLYVIYSSAHRPSAALSPSHSPAPRPSPLPTRRRPRSGRRRPIHRRSIGWLCRHHRPHPPRGCIKPMTHTT
jgi:hypothetical protein